MDKVVATLNIKHYKKLLASETDAAKREAIACLLARELTKQEKRHSSSYWPSSTPSDCFQQNQR
jgi:hypothetical protein